MSDKIIDVQNAIQDFIWQKVISTGFEYEELFDTGNPNIDYQRVQWNWTQDGERPVYPYIYLSHSARVSNDFGNFYEYESRTVNDVKKLYKIEKQFNRFTFGVVVNTACKLTQSGDLGYISGNKIAGYLKKCFKSDEANDWFSGGENDAGVNIGIQTNGITEIIYLPEYEDVRPRHRFRFEVTVNWTDVFETEVNLARAVRDVDTNEIISLEEE